MRLLYLIILDDFIRVNNHWYRKCKNTNEWARPSPKLLFIKMEDERSNHYLTLTNMQRDNELGKI